MTYSLRILALGVLLSCSHLAFSAEMSADGKKDSGAAAAKMSDKDKAMAAEKAKEKAAADAETFHRPRPPIELGNKFLGTGTLSPGFTLPTGAVWQPSLLVFGTMRNVLQTQDTGVQDAPVTTEFVNRLDLFAQLYLTSTERVLIGVRPFDHNASNYLGYRFHPNEDGTGRLNANITTLFFEGDFGEIFPNLDFYDRKGLDIGFAIGRQPISFQEGIMINDTIDAIGITQNSLRPDGTSNLRITGLYGWNSVNRSNNVEDNSTNLYGLFSEADFPFSTVALDLIYTDSDRIGSAYFLGLSAVQRIGEINTAFRLLTSNAADSSPAAATGQLLFAETSWAPKHTDDSFYINGFAAFDNYTSAARREEVGGPLGRAGILFAAPGIGTMTPALSNRAKDVVLYDVSSGTKENREENY